MERKTLPKKNEIFLAFDSLIQFLYKTIRLNLVPFNNAYNGKCNDIKISIIKIVFHLRETYVLFREYSNVLIKSRNTGFAMCKE